MNGWFIVATCQMVLQHRTTQGLLGVCTTLCQPASGTVVFVLRLLVHSSRAADCVVFQLS
jgi:hypothetical protein